MALKDWLEDHIEELVPLCQSIADNYGITKLIPVPGSLIVIPAVGGEEDPLWQIVARDCYTIKELVEAMPEDY